MPAFGELMGKLGRGEVLTPREQMELHDEARALEEARILVKSWVSPGTRTPIFIPPISVIYSEELAENKTSITVPIPGDFRHLWIYGSGSITTANGGNIWAQFNGDTGNNYTWQLIASDGATVSGMEDTSDPYVALGVFGTTGAGAGVNGGFRAEVLHYRGAWKKNVLSHAFTAEFNDLYVLGSTWANVATIKTVEIFGTDNTLAKGTASIAAGSLISVYGLI